MTTPASNIMPIGVVSNQVAELWAEVVALREREAALRAALEFVEQKCVCGTWSLSPFAYLWADDWRTFKAMVADWRASHE